MILLVASPELRLDVVRDLKAGGYIVTGPHEDDQGDAGAYSVHVEDVPGSEEERVMQIARAADPSVRLAPSS